MHHRLQSVSERATSIALFLVVSIVVGIAAETIVFGPQTYTRGTGRPVAVRKTFPVTQPSGKYTLRVTNRGVTSAVVTLNGRVVLDPDDFTPRHGRDRDDFDHDRDNDRRERNGRYRNDRDRDDWDRYDKDHRDDRGRDNDRDDRFSPS